MTQAPNVLENRLRKRLPVVYHRPTPLGVATAAMILDYDKWIRLAGARAAEYHSVAPFVPRGCNGARSLGFERGHHHSEESQALHWSLDG